MKKPMSQKAINRKLEREQAKREYRKPLTGRMIDCPGEAHEPGNMSDHCGCCLNHTWGKVPEKGPADLDEAKRLGLDVPLGQLNEQEYEAAQARIAGGEATIQPVNLPSRSYHVLRWTKQA